MSTEPILIGRPEAVASCSGLLSFGLYFASRRPFALAFRAGAPGDASVGRSAFVLFLVVPRPSLFLSAFASGDLPTLRSLRTAPPAGGAVPCALRDGCAPPGLTAHRLRSRPPFAPPLIDIASSRLQLLGRAGTAPTLCDQAFPPLSMVFRSPFTCLRALPSRDHYQAPVRACKPAGPKGCLLSCKGANALRRPPFVPLGCGWPGKR